jgi:replicative DNA helicase
MLSNLRESGCLTAETRISRADTGGSVTMGELYERGERDIPVWALDATGSMVRATMSHVFSSGVKKIFELRLASGRRVTASANHPFRTFDGWHPLAELAVGDRVAVPARLPSPSARSQLDDAEVVALADTGPGRVADVVFSLDDEQVALFVGSLWAHGGSVLDAGRPGWGEPAAPGGTGGGARAEGDVSATDGCGFVNHPGEPPLASFTASTRALADDVQALLLRLGIASRIRAVAAGSFRPGHQVWIHGERDTAEFLRRVAPHCAEGRFRPTVSLLTDRDHAVVEATDPGRPGARVTTIAPPATTLSGRGSDVSWDEVVAIEAVGEAPVFDATVATHHNFVANGIIAHNSIEQDADVVLFIYREEAYDPETPAERRGVAEIIVSKHRNGRTGSVHLAFLNQYARFDNIKVV